MAAKSKTFICAAIDFGTMYTGYAYSFLSNKDNILTNYWTETQIKTPTVVLMQPDCTFHSFGEDARKHYKQLMTDEKHKEWYFFERFKMKLLAKDEPLNKDMQIEDILGKSMPAIDVFAAAIKYIKSHLMGVLNDKERKGNADTMTTKDIHWILTVPAIWDDLAKTFMRNAAQKADIPDELLTLALEPEAASLFCKKEFGNNRIPHGCRYAVFDLGGGTADITCHEVNSDGTLKELQPPTGGDFGGIMVDLKFLDMLHRLFGAPIIHKFRQEYMPAYWELMSDFEIKKRKFDGTGNMILKFPPQVIEMYNRDIGESFQETLKQSPMHHNIKYKHGKLHISNSLSTKLFEEPFKKITETVSDLLNKFENTLYIIMVGGFSESPYLQKIMTKLCQNLTISPSEPSAAVLKGAVLYGQETRAIASRICRYTYGIAQMVKFKSHHPESKKRVIDNFTYCDDVFNKHIEIGHEVSVHSPDKAKPHTYYPSSFDMRQAVLEVYASKEKNPTFIDGPGCRFVGLIKIDINPNGDIWSELLVKLIFGGTELIVEITDVNNHAITQGYVDFIG